MPCFHSAIYNFWDRQQHRDTPGLKCHTQHCVPMQVESVQLIADGKAPRVPQTEEGASYEGIQKKSNAKVRDLSPDTLYRIMYYYYFQQLLVKYLYWKCIKIWINHVVSVQCSSITISKTSATNSGCPEQSLVETRGNFIPCHFFQSWPGKKTLWNVLVKRRAGFQKLVPFLTHFLLGNKPIFIAFGW